MEYDPIINCLCVCDVEYSNCPADEIDENGDMLILFGKLSRSPKRIDDNYYNLIEGLSAVFATIIGSNIGALAGIMRSNILNKHGVKFGYLDFLKIGVTVAIPTLIARSVRCG